MRTERNPIYIAHQLSSRTQGGTDHNLHDGACWCAWLAQHFDIAPQAPWIALATIWHETPENRARGLECDFTTIQVCSGLWMVGPRISEGMLLEARHAHACGKVIRDLTEIPFDHPDKLKLVAARIHIRPPYVPTV